MKTETENNKLIAEFMGAKVGGTNIATYPDGKLFYIGNDKLVTRQVHYNTSWDWLMPVVEKCLIITCDNELHEWDISISETLRSVNISTLYKEIIEFINWYNENK